MRKVKFICRQCGYRFEEELFEEGEAEEKRLSIAPVRCPKCHGAVERLS